MEQALFESRQLTPDGEYTSGIEGPAVDVAGVLYVVNFQRQGTIGRVKPGATQSELFAELPNGSVGNGIRFDSGGRMYVADFKRHHVFVIQPHQVPPRPHPYFHSGDFNQPNDLAIAKDGTLYASDPKFSQHAGQVWRIARGLDMQGHGEVMASERAMHVTNGIDLSPDDGTLYVSESDTREVWAYRIDGAKLTAPKLVKRFDQGELDGLRTDIDGRIYVARNGHGTIALLTPDGDLVREIRTRGRNPTNLTFGGGDGMTVYVTQADGRFIESFKVDRPGREPFR